MANPLPPGWLRSSSGVLFAPAARQPCEHVIACEPGAGVFGRILCRTCCLHWPREAVVEARARVEGTEQAEG